MYLNNVFYGFTKDGVDRLLWKKNKTYWTSVGSVTTTIYYDLNSKEEFDLNFVDIPSLKSITNLVGNFKWLKRKKVKNVYNADRSMLLDVQGAFYGDIISKKKVNNAQIISNDVKKNILFARIDDPEGRSLDVKNGYLLSRTEHVLKGVCVKEVRPINTEQFDDVVAPKRKLLELDYKKEL